ncbi:MAG: guanylate kinase [Bacteroidetes bacterium]|jgi:guanylate kinase|nr:guanylate kinase [Bacteroidota bacterium]
MSSNSIDKGKLLIFSAPSGSGKTTLVKHLLQRIDGLVFSVSATSRPARKGEIDGKDYYFLSVEAFKEKIQHQEFLEWEEVYPDVFYGTLYAQVAQKRAQGLHVIFDVDVVGGLNIKKYYGKDALAIFVQAPSMEILAERLKQRGSDDTQSIQKRLEKAQWEMNFAPQFDHIIVNDKLEKAQQLIETKVKAFLSEH